MLAPWAGRKLLCGGGGWHGSPIAQPPPSLVGVPGGVWAGAALPAVPGGGGGPTPTYLAHNDPHVALIILTTHMCGGNFFVKKKFPGQNLCSGAFGGNIRPYTKQRARHGSPFLEPPPPPSPGAHAIPPLPPTKQFSGRPALSLAISSFTVRSGRLDSWTLLGEACVQVSGQSHVVHADCWPRSARTTLDACWTLGLRTRCNSGGGGPLSPSPKTHCPPL